MAYEKQTWAKGDVVTSAKLNHIEDGIATGGGVLAVNGTIDGNTMTLDKTWQEIHDAGAAILKFEISSDQYIAWLVSVVIDNGVYVCEFIGSNNIDFTTDSADGYPSATMGLVTVKE